MARYRDCGLFQDGCIINEESPDAGPTEDFGCDAMERTDDGE